MQIRVCLELLILISRFAPEKHPPKSPKLQFPEFPGPPVFCIQERKSSLNIKFLGGISHGHPGGYPGGRPGPKTFTPSLGVQENKDFCADVLDPKARTSVIRGGLRKTLCRRTSGLFFILNVEIVRHGETIKINFRFLRGGGLGGREENRPKSCFSCEMPRQQHFESANFIVEKFCCHCAGS